MNRLNQIIAGIVGFVVLVGMACSVPGLTSTTTDTAALDFTATPRATPTPPPTPQPRVEASGDQPVQLRGEIDLTSDIFVTYVVEYYAMLEDLTGFVQRDYEYEQPLDPQILGPVTVDDLGTYSYLINLPAVPGSPFNDVDNNGSDDTGVQIWQVVFTGNLIGDPFLKENETGGWSTVYTSALIDSENKDELVGGKLLVWAPDDAQGFPSEFGADGLLFTGDEDTLDLPAGYSVVDLDTEPFSVIQERTPDVRLLEGDIAVNDLSEMGWAEAFDALFAKASVEYPFTESKSVDWQAIYDEIAPRVARAEERSDERAFYLAMRDFTLMIPDGHVGISGDDFGTYRDGVVGGFGVGAVELSDGRVIAAEIIPQTPASDAGMLPGAEILEWGGLPVQDAIEAVFPWEGPESAEHVRRLKAVQYLTRAPLGERVEVTFQNPGANSPETATLEAVFEIDTLLNASFFAGLDFDAVPITYETLPGDVGYVRITSLYDDLSLLVRIWERAINVFVNNGTPTIIVDMRQNTGGSPLGTFFAGYFTDETIDVRRSYYYSDTSGEFETYGPPSRIEPDPDLRYDGDIIVLVSPACASACEDVAFTLALLPQTQVVGFYPTNGIFGEVGRGQYDLPAGYSLQIPTGRPVGMDGEIIIEDTGVVPDITVPVTEESVFYEGDDYLLDWVLERVRSE